MVAEQRRENIPMQPLLPNNIFQQHGPIVHEQHANEVDVELLEENQIVEQNAADFVDPPQNELNEDENVVNEDEFENENNDENNQDQLEEEEEDHEFLHNNHADERGWNPDAIMEDLTWEKACS